MTIRDVCIGLPETSFYPDEVIQGAITLQVTEAFDCGGISIILEWFIRGSGEGNESEVETKKLFQGHLRPGKYRYPFTLVAPKGPFTYQGKLLSVGWLLRAEIELPWTLDAKTTAAIELVPSPEMSPTAPYSFGSVGKSEPSKSMLSYLAEGKISTPEVTFSKQVVCRGDSLDVRLRFLAKASITFDEMFAELSCREIVRGGIVFREESIYQSKVALVSQEEPGMLDAYRDSARAPECVESAKRGETVTLGASLSIPQDAPISFSAESYIVETRINVCLGIRGWPDWNGSFPIMLHPGGYAKVPRGHPDVEASKEA